MGTIAVRLSLVSVAVLVFPGCLELALIQALDNKDREEDVDSYDYTDTDTSYDDSSYEEPYDDDTDYDDPSYSSTQALDIRNASLSGDMGEVRDFSDEGGMRNGYDYGSYATLEIHARAENGAAAMAIVYIEGGLANPDLAPGSHQEFTGYQTTSNGLCMYVIGCSGPSEGSWSFDQESENVTVDVTATAVGTTALDFTATFSDGQTVVGSAELAPLQAQ